jgi:hypothetical protein
LNAGAIRAFDKIGKSVNAKSLEHSKIAYTTFKAETVTTFSYILMMYL